MLIQLTQQNLCCQWGKRWRDGVGAGSGMEKWVKGELWPVQTEPCVFMRWTHARGRSTLQEEVGTRGPGLSHRAMPSAQVSAPCQRANGNSSSHPWYKVQVYTHTHKHIHASQTPPHTYLHIYNTPPTHIHTHPHKHKETHKHNYTHNTYTHLQHTHTYTQMLMWTTSSVTTSLIQYKNTLSFYETNQGYANFL